MDGIVVETGAAVDGHGPIAPGATVTLEAKALAVLGAHADDTGVDHSVEASLSATGNVRTGPVRRRTRKR